MDKCRICLVCVCFNAYKDASELLESVSKAYSRCAEVELTVVLGDNSVEELGVELVRDVSFDFKFFYQKNANIGYFPAFCKGVRSQGKPLDHFDYVIVSNVDLILDEDFFKNLRSLIVGSHIGVIAPAILSMNHGSDLNPKMLERPSREKIEFMIRVCSNGFLFLLHRFASSMRDKIRAKSAHLEVRPKGGEMYGAHGAFMVFTRHYFECGGSINYPRFLFGEEGFVAEETRRVGLVVQHVESLVVHDKEHGSTSLKSSKFLACEHKKSYEFFLNHYF